MIDDKYIIANDHFKRSKFIYDILKKENKKNQFVKTRIPKLIIQFWHDAGNIPEDVSECIKSWKILKNEGFSFVLYDDESARKFILQNFDQKYIDAYNKCHHPAMRCDYFRLCYIYKRRLLY